MTAAAVALAPAAALLATAVFAACYRPGQP